MSSSDAASSATALPAFDDCADRMLEGGILMSPSELHGALCGLLGGSAASYPGDMLAALEAALAVSLTGPAADCSNELDRVTRAVLAEEPYRFQPLLPDDDTEIAQRVASLAAWCRGYLGGYAQARVANAGADAPVAADTAEVLRDFAAIAQADIDDEAGGSSTNPDGDDEEAEHHYMEVVEYLRAATLTVMADVDGQNADVDQPQGSGGTLH